MVKGKNGVSKFVSVEVKLIDGFVGADVPPTCFCDLLVLVDAVSAPTFKSWVIRFK